MNDNDVIAIIISILNAGFSANSLPNIVVKQSYQPTQQGVPEAPTVFLHKVSAPRYGFPGRIPTYNETDGDFDVVDTIWRTPTFQVNGLAQQDPSDLTSLTSSDIVELASDILQTVSTVETLLQSGIGIERIRSIRQIYFVNDKGRHEQEPSFDFTLSYRRETTRKVAAVTTYEANINRV